MPSEDIRIAGELPPLASPYYEGNGVRLYLGDTREVLFGLHDNGDKFSALVTDPPYAAWRYLTETEARGELSLLHDVNWQAETFAWVGEWFPPLRHLMATEGVAWLYCNPHYLGFYVRWAIYQSWPWRAIWSLPPNELLLHLGPENLSADWGREVQASVGLNTYGQDKPVGVLTTLLEASFPGAVIDPFSGGGNTLVAAQRLGREAVGIDIDEWCCERAAKKLRLEAGG